MKKLTFSSMAAARLRANKRQYVCLVLGIFLAIFLVTTLFLAAQGFILAKVEQTNKNVGRLDAFLVDTPDISDEVLLNFDKIQEIGHVYVTASVEATGDYLGYYDETGAAHMYRTVLEGRMPESSGEIAIEQSALLALDVERNWQIGDSIPLSLLPIDGQPEERTFTLVGILKDQSEKLNAYKNRNTARENVKQFPALLTSSKEEGFDSGRIAVHRTFLIDGGKLAEPYIDQFYDAIGIAWTTHSFGKGDFHAISASGRINDMDELWPGIKDDPDILLPLILGILLGVALMVSCGVGISTATESVLTRRREEIGLLRVVGATKRQIRRIFGRESVILALLVAPLSIAVSICAVGLLSLIVPDQMILNLNPVLLLPISITSLFLIVLSGYMPLRRYASQMPMSVIRDTEVLRKIKHIKTKKQFRVENLISTRLLRLYPSRQIGSGILVVLMLLCVFCAVMCVNTGFSYIAQDTAAFVISTQDNGMAGYVSVLPSPPLSEQSLWQIRKLPHVSRVEVERFVGVTALLEEKSDYMIRGYPDQYNKIQNYLNTDKELAGLTIHTVVLDEEALLKYSRWVEDGKIDVKAINAGREVIISAPKIWSGEDQYGNTYTRRGPEAQDENAVLVAENDCFYVGQGLPLTQLYTQTVDDDNIPVLNAIEHLDTTVTVGAILNQDDGQWFTRATVLTTEEGLKNMGLYANGMDTYRVYLDGDVDLQTEELLAQSLEAIGSRAGKIHLYNRIASYRESIHIRNQMVAVFSGIGILFTVVAINMIVSSITRRIQADGRRIGMLRAVGADEKTILRCYIGQVSFSILGGYLLTSVILLIILFTANIQGFALYFGYGFAAMTLFAVVSWVICRLVLGRRIRSVISQSIIDNIREL